jgi:hypothetical protein
MRIRLSYRIRLEALDYSSVSEPHTSSCGALVLKAALLADRTPHDVVLTTSTFDPRTGIAGRVDMEDCLDRLGDRHCGLRRRKRYVLDVCGGNRDRLLFMEGCVWCRMGELSARLYILFHQSRLS